MKIMRIKSNLVVILEDGTRLVNSSCTEEMYLSLMENLGDEEYAKNLLMPEYNKVLEERENTISLLESYEKSEYLSVEGSSVYLKSISELSLPKDLALAIYKAEKAEDLVTLSSYLNFWTLCSLNPDSRARINLFWFLEKYGMSISKSGLFVSYRNVRLKSEGKELSSDWAKFITDELARVRYRLKRNPRDYFIGTDENGDKICTVSIPKLVENKGNLYELYNKLGEENVAPVYTDSYTGKFVIKIGSPVTMDRAKCDPNQDNTCSKGLHVAGKDWLEGNYFGDTGLRVLVNPADVVAVPPRDSYGKMRTCAYYPVGIVDFNEEGKIVDEDIEDGFEDNFMDLISYEGEVNKSDADYYKITIPSIPELNRSKIMERLDDIKEILKLKNQSNAN